MLVGGFKYAPGLDGVRALAVLSVFVYHLGITGGGAHYLQGGFIGVDVFFVLSGYLITSLLKVEFLGTGRVSIKDFYLRRARRLLPAVFALMLAVMAIGIYWLPQQAARIRGDLLASLFYAQNWWLIFQEHSYFGTGDRPPLLTHLWSLAVEEQFYLVWPLALLLFAVNRARRRTMITVLLLAILVSTLAAALIYDPWADPSRVYYGTDTRAAAPLLGAALALLLRPWQQRKSQRSAPWDLLGLAGLAALAAIAYFVGDRDPLLYQGGFLITALAAGALVASAGHPASLLGDILGVQPFRWLGQRSYAFYLWHWPVCALTQPQLDVPLTGWANTGLRLGLTLALAELSYWLIERHFRTRSVVPQLAAATPPLSSPGPSHRDPTFTPLLSTPGPSHPDPAFTPALSTPEPSHRAPAAAPPLSTPGPSHRAPAFTSPHSAAKHSLRDTTFARLPGRRHAPPRRPAVAAVALITIFLGASGFLGWQLHSTVQLATFAPGGPPPDGAPDVALPVVLPAPSVAASPRTPPIRVTLFGDSQGRALFASKPSDVSKFLTLTDSSATACGILRGKVRSSVGETHDLIGACPNWLSQWDRDVKKSKPDIALVMIGAWETFDLFTGTEKLIFGSAEWDSNFLDTLLPGLQALRNSGSAVAIALLPCYRPFRNTGGAGYWPDRGDDTRTAHVNSLLKSAAVTTGSSTVDPPAVFCTDQSIATDTKYRWDGVHYTKPGAALYFTALIPQLLTVPA